MPKYLFEVRYTPAGAAGLMRDGGTKRRAAAAELVESLGGSMETMYFAFGDRDAYAIVDLPNEAAAVAASLAVNASGATTGHLTVLLAPEELDAAARHRVAYTPPGQ